MDLTGGSFAPDAASACRACAARSAATPPRQTAQERLHRLVAAADAGPLRDDLLEALRNGAQVNPWVVGVSADRARSSTRLHEAIEGRDQASAALDAGGTFQLAEVATDACRFVAIIPTDARPVIVRRSSRRRAAPERPGWTFTDAREAAWFGVGSAGGTEHALDGAGTLCGIPPARVTAQLHLFTASSGSACPSCAALAAAAPTRPCAQERLHTAIATAAPGPLRDDLAAALTRGAEITLWIGALGPDLAKHYADLDELDDNRAALAAALAVNEHAGLAHVLHGSWRSTVLLRDGEPPLIARGRT
ncbi:hypothetical protein ACQEVZ_32210 [Dactylosporangium sp. CA-152071]|uniref:hypothetical protein n=1 Tax=Dactylosporangium sp. CA-152071 TaxID=3239933 RepID=UPI003D8C59D1